VTEIERQPFRQKHLGVPDGKDLQVRTGLRATDGHCRVMIGRKQHALVDETTERDIHFHYQRAAANAAREVWLAHRQIAMTETKRTKGLHG
jgi:hypothetical protein